MDNQQYSHIKRMLGDYTVSYGLIQSLNPSYDTIDFFKINDYKYGLYLADVAGPGDNTAVINRLQQIINHHCLECLTNKDGCILDPAMVLENINLEMYSEKLSKYVTLFYGLLDLNTNILNYSIAGHYPNPILVDNQLNAKYVLNKGYPLGLVPKANFENYNIKFNANDSLVLFSNGIMNYFKSDSAYKDKSDSLLDLICNSKLDISNILHNLKLDYNTVVVDDIVIFTIQKIKSKN